jgi:hypothetical protein
MLTEEWRPVVGYEGFYEVSDAGRVRRIKGYNSVKAGTLLSGSISDGYRRVILGKDGKHRKHFVHDLVCEAFYGPRPSPRHEAAHWDNCRTNNSLGNLRWATRESNKADMLRHGTRLRGDSSPVAKLTEGSIAAIFRLRNQGMPQTEIAGLFHVTQANISCVLTRKTWKHVEVTL